MRVGDMLVLVFNNCNEGRFPLSIALSEDGGTSWNHIRDLEPDVDFDHEQPNRDKHTTKATASIPIPPFKKTPFTTDLFTSRTRLDAKRSNIPRLW